MTNFVALTCRCGVKFGLEPGTDRHLRQSSQIFYCPFGHAAVWPQGESEEDKLRRERDSLKQNTAYLQDRNRQLAAERDAAERRASAMKGQVTRLKNRAAAGVCPCCNRTFQNLQRHMATKHSGFLAEEVLPEGASLQ